MPKEWSLPILTSVAVCVFCVLATVITCLTTVLVLDARNDHQDKNMEQLVQFLNSKLQPPAAQ